MQSHRDGIGIVCGSGFGRRLQGGCEVVMTGDASRGDGELGRERVREGGVKETGRVGRGE